MRAGDLLVHRFELESLAGAGGMGRVFRARDRLTGDHVALKVLHSAEHAERFVREARVIAELAHPHIVRHIAHGTTPDGAAWLAIEWLEGEDLAARLARSPLGIAECMAVARAAAEGLGAAHALGVVHRDIKPSNLFLVGGDPSRLRIIDFGVARVDGTAALTATGAMVGTPGYIAPEQARGEEDVDSTADIFSLGCVLFRCLTGRPAFFGDDVLAILAKLVLEEPPRVRDLAPGVSDALDALVGRMLAKDRSLRPRDGRALLDALDRIDLSDMVLPCVGPSDPPALTTGETRICSVLVVAPGAPAKPGATLAIDEECTSHVRDVATHHGGELHLLRDVTICTFAGAATIGAARCGFELAHRGLRVALATGRARVADRSASNQSSNRARPVGEAIDRAVALIHDAALPRVAIDAVTAELLTGRFVIAESAGRFDLVRERLDEPTPVRTLLGRSSACVGRDRELATLELTWDDCVREQRARPVLVTAAAGTGKTRLAHEFVARLQARRNALTIWIGRSDPMTAGSPLRMLSQAMKSAAGIQDGEPLDARRTKLRALVERHTAPSESARLAEFLGEMIGSPFPDEGRIQLQAARADAKLMADQMRAAWEDFLLAEATAIPVLLVLEDLHWGDGPTVSFVDSALRELGERACMVLAFARPEVESLFPGIWRERDVLEMRLEPLSRKASERLARDALGASADANAIARLVERAAGNAFFLEELIRAEAQGRAGVLPETVLGLVEGRLGELDLESRRIMRAASLFGTSFWLGAVAALVGGAKRHDDVVELLRVLAERELLHVRRETRFPGEREYAFRHAIVRDAAYATLIPDDRVLGHRLAGHWLERAGETDALVIAEHFQKGGESERAAKAFLRAARQALEADDLAATIRRAERGVACGATGELLGALRFIQASAQNWGRAPSADIEHYANEAMSLLPVESADWFAALATSASAAFHLGHIDRVRHLADVVLTASCDASSAQSRAMTMCRLAPTLFRLGDPRAERLVVGVNEPGVGELALGFGYNALALRALLANDPAGHLAAFELSYEMFERAGHRRYATVASANVGFALIELGQAVRAEQRLRAALTLGIRLGLADVVASCHENLGVALALQGKLDEGRRMEELAVADYVRQGNIWGEGDARIYLARICLMSGDVARARTEAERAAVVLEEVPSLRPYALAVLAQAALARGDVTDAQRAAVEAIAGVDGVQEGASTIRLAYAKTLEAAGDRAAARDAIAVARDRLLEQAARITDPSLRATYLELVPDNARTLELARALLPGARS